jgi:hypothetical protein
MNYRYAWLRNHLPLRWGYAILTFVPALLLGASIGAAEYGRDHLRVMREMWREDFLKGAK